MASKWKGKIATMHTKNKKCIFSLILKTSYKVLKKDTIK